MVSKVSTKKKATKKEPKKKKTDGVKIEITILKKAPKSKEFYLLDGRKLADLRDLAFALGDMADDVFWHHVNDARNDFEAWVKDVIKDNELADELKNIRDRFNAQVSVLRHIVKKI